ncbi:BBSome complex assembly protein BBS10 isoform 3-T5 [Spinachia spinachia]
MFWGRSGSFAFELFFVLTCAVQSVGMLPVEHLHLEHVLQTVCVLESVISRSFGPEGGQVLFTQDTGQAMLSRSGARILTALHLEHPLARLSGATPVRDYWVIEPEHVATLTFCKPILLGAHRYVHVGFRDSEEKITVKPCSLVLCGLGEGQTDQFASALKDAMRMLLSTWDPVGFTAATASKRTSLSIKSTSLNTDNQIPNAAPFQQCVLEPGCVIPAGGTFEFLLNNALVQHGSSCSISDDKNIGVPAVSQLLAKALLSVPRQIYYHSPRRLLQTQTRLLSFIKSHSHNFSIAHKQEVLMSGSGLESVSCKSQVLLAALQCVSSLLRVDAILHTHTALHTQPHRGTNISWAGTEDETED